MLKVFFAAAALAAMAASGCKARDGRTELKVVGGERVENDAYDAVVGLVELEGEGEARVKTVFCTGTVISRTVVLTAAHCLNDMIAKGSTAPDLSRFQIMIGNDVGAATGNRFLGVKSAARHEDYKFEGDAFHHDVGYVVVSENFPESVAAIPVFTSGFKLGRHLQDNKADETPIVEVVGFGRTDPNNPRTGVKHRATTLIDGTTALAFDTLVIGSSEKDACKGDSGGPVFVTYQGTRYVAATVSGAADFIRGADGDTIYIICRGKTRTMRMAAYHKWVTEKAGVSFPALP